jgi:hypothetical protein
MNEENFSNVVFSVPVMTDITLSVTDSDYSKKIFWYSALGNPIVADF